MSVSEGGSYESEHGWETYSPTKGYRFEAEGIATRPGSSYRLEVEADGYKMITSTSIMPYPPDVSASINTNVAVKKQNVKEYRSLEGWTYGGMSGHDYLFCPVSLQWGERNAGRNYYALEMYHEKVTIEGTPDDWYKDGIVNAGVFVDDLSLLQDNPEVEIFENQDMPGIDTDSGSAPVDMYYFPILLMSDLYFTHDNVSFTLFQYQRLIKESSLTLRVRRITKATFIYYRSLALQSTGMGFFSEPVAITGNVENGYGAFNVFNAVDIELGK
jgi:hypothetical protein